MTSEEMLSIVPPLLATLTLRQARRPLGDEWLTGSSENCPNGLINSSSQGEQRWSVHHRGIILAVF